MKRVRNLRIPKMHPPRRIHVGDIVFVGNRMMRMRVTNQVRPGLYEGVNERSGKTLRFKKTTVRQKSPMSPLLPTVVPRAQAIGIHDGCGGVVFYSRTRRIGDRFCDRCRADGRFGRPRPILDSEVNPIGREPMKKIETADVCPKKEQT